MLSLLLPSLVIVLVVVAVVLLSLLLLLSAAVLLAALLLAVEALSPALCAAAACHKGSNTAIHDKYADKVKSTSMQCRV
jgi:hypothetical protein